jgi:SAM-dependent methyltransferase
VRVYAGLVPYGFMPPGPPRFGDVAEAYDAYRVGYTALVYEHHARRCGLVPGARVIDLGCGNGLSTVPLVERGADVVAIDPDEAMLEHAAHRLGERAILLAGRAEQIPLPDACADLVVAAQSAHFFEEPTARREIRRVLRPGGVCAFLWKYPAPDTRYVYLVDEVLVQRLGVEVRTMYGVGTVPELLGDGFEEYERAVFEQPVTYTIDSYIGYVSSRDRFRRIAGERSDELLDVLAARLREREPAGAFVERNLVYVVSARTAG